MVNLIACGGEVMTMVNLIDCGGEVMTDHSLFFKSDLTYVPSISVKV